MRIVSSAYDGAVSLPLQGGIFRRWITVGAHVVHGPLSPLAVTTELFLPRSPHFILGVSQDRC